MFRCARRLIEIQDAAGAPIPGCALDDCREIIGDEIARTVAWTHGPDLSRLAGQPVRLRFVMKDADLYSIRFTSGEWAKHKMHASAAVIHAAVFKPG